MFLAKIEGEEKQKSDDRRDDGRDTGTDDSQRWKTEFPEHHHVAKRYVDDQTKHVTDHDYVGSADTGKIG
jgi:hypothetical protein